MNVFDIVLIIFILLGGLQGLQRGLVTGIANLIGAIAGFIIAASQYLKFLTWIEKHIPIRQWLEPKIYDMLLPAVKTKVSTVEGQTLNSILNLFPPTLRENLNLGSLPNLEGWTQKASEQLTLNLAGIMTEHILRIIAFILLYFIVVAVIQLIVSIVLSPIGGREGALNRFGGAIFGSLSTFIFFSVLIGMITPFLNVITTDLPLKDWIQNALLYPYLISMFEFISGFFWSTLGSEIFEPLNQQREMWL